MSERRTFQPDILTPRSGAVVDRTLRFIELDESFAELVGARPDELIGRRVGDVFPHLEGQLGALLAGGAADERVLLHVAGDTPVHLRLSPLRTSRGTIAGLELAVEPISTAPGGEARERLELPSVGAVLDSLFVFAGVLLPDGTLIEANRTALEAAQLTPSDVLGRPFEDTYWWSHDPAVQAQLRDAIARAARGATVRYDVVVRLGTARFITIDFMLAPAYDRQGGVQYLVPSAIDVSDRKEAEAAIQASEERFRATFERAPVGVAHVALDGRWLRVNPHLCAIVGYPLEELTTRTFQELTYPDDLAADEVHVEQLLAGAIGSYTMEKRYIRKDGSLVWVNLTVSLVRTAEGQPHYFIAVVEDIAQRKAAEAELRFQAQLLDAVGQGVIATNFDGTVRYWNRFAEYLYGWRRDEAIGRNILDLIAAEHSLEQGQSIMASLQAGETWTGTYQVRRHDGSTFPAFVTDTPLYGPDGTIQGIVGVSSDVTRQQRLEAEREELLRSERSARARADEALALLDTLLTTAPIGFCFLSPDLRYLRINQALAQLNGLPPEAHLGRTVREVLPNLAQVVEPLLAQVLATGQPLLDIEVVEERPGANGQRIWQASYYPVYLSDGTLAGIGVVTNDITAPRAAADALRLSEERFRVALQHSPILVYTTDRDLRYTWVYNLHPAFEATAVVGRRDEDLLAPAEAARLTALKQRVLARELGERAEVPLVVRGRPYVYDLTVEPLRDQHGAVVGLTVAAFDISGLRATEAALREAVEARDSFIAVASHDLRSPLTTIFGQAELLERRAGEYQLPERVVRAVRSIADQARRMNRMLGALLDLSRIQSGQLALDRVPLDFAALVVRCIEESRPTLANHTIALDGAVGGLWVQGDEVRLEQVLLNLLSNAVKYSPDGGAIRVCLEGRDGWACVAVSDQGIGVPAEALPRLFERFYRAVNAEASGIGGLGIGLYAVQEIIALHGGTIAVTSAEGHGSTFTACLPLLVAT